MIHLTWPDAIVLIGLMLFCGWLVWLRYRADRRL
jgi:hypothetical protein